MAYEDLDLESLQKLRRQVKDFMRMGWSRCHLDDVDEAIRKRREAIRAAKLSPKPIQTPRPAKRYPKRRKSEPWGDWYQRYLASPHWQSLRREKLFAAGHRCEVCKSAQRLEVHHVTYKRLRQETLADLRVLCSECHRDAHGHQTALDAEFRAIVSGVA